MHLNHPELVYEHPAHLVNPRRACAARVLCVCVCVCVCVSTALQATIHEAAH